MNRTHCHFRSAALALAVCAVLFTCCQKPEPKPAKVAVMAVALDKTTLSLEVGASESLTATVFPDNATNKSVSWKSSDEGVATVDAGKVTAVKAGTASITATTLDRGKTATCTVTVTETGKVIVTGNKAKIPAEGGEVEFPIQYNTSYTVEIEWLAQTWHPRVLGRCERGRRAPYRQGHGEAG